MRRKDGGLAVKAKDRAVDIRLPRKNTNVVRQIAGREIIGAVHNHVVVGNNCGRVFAREPAIVQFDFDVRVDVT